ncbi:MAG TPA: sodium:solute symporter family protein [Bacteroidota bacterium]|nr:sodium:solute symporter family protein [Bacteroidota bacterium]
MTPIFLGILLYVLLQLLLGYTVSRRIRTEDDYLLAGRNLGYVLATFSIFATWFGAESCIGTAGAAYAEGISGVAADPFGYAVCLFLMGLFFAVPLWRMKLTTIADFFRIRFSASTERVIAVIMIPTSLLWAAAQIRAFGLVLSASSVLEVSTAVTVAATAVIAYTIMGGMLADAMTDIVQGFILIAGLALLAVTLIADSGGIIAALQSVPAERLALSSSGTQGVITSVLRTAETWAIPILGSVTAQEMVSRVLASRSPMIARRSSLMAGGTYLLVGLIPLGVGLLGSSILPGLDQPEQILPMVAQQHFSTIGYIVFAGALVSAILSTVDSALLAASGIFCHNILIPLQPQMEEHTKVRIQRLGVFVMGLLAYMLAMYAQGVYDLVKEASAFGSGAVFVVFMFGMYTKFGGARSATTALVVGCVLWLFAHYVASFEFSFLLATVCSLAAYSLFALAERAVPEVSPSDR